MLARIAEEPTGEVVVAHTPEGVVVGYVAVLEPEPGTRFASLPEVTGAAVVVVPVEPLSLSGVSAVATSPGSGQPASRRNESGSPRRDRFIFMRT